MSTILLKAELEEVGSDNLDNYSFKRVSRQEMSKLVEIEGFVDKFIQRNLTQWEQDVLNDYTKLTMEQCCTIIKNCEGKAETCIVSCHKNLPLDFLNEYAHKLPLYYIEHQQNIDKQFFQKHRENMDVSSFLDYRVKLGDVLTFLDVERDREQYMNSAFNYRVTREEVYHNALNAKPDYSTEDIVELNTILDDIYNHEVNVEYLTECYEKPNVSHTVRDVVRYYNNNHNNQYSTWTEFVQHARSNANSTLAEVWFKDSFAPRILSFIKG